MSSIHNKSADSKRKSSRSSTISGYWIKNGLNNLLIICKVFNKKGGYSWFFYKKAHQYKDCRSIDHEQTECELK